MTTLLLILTAVGATRALFDLLPMPDIKPLNCPPCLTFWLSLPFLYICGVNPLFAFVAYLIQRML
jgi:hypothetical protein